MALRIIRREHSLSQNDRNWEIRRAAEWLNVWQPNKDLSVPSTEATVYIFQNNIYFWNNNSVIFLSYSSGSYYMYISCTNFSLLLWGKSDDWWSCLTCVLSLPCKICLNNKDRNFKLLYFPSFSVLHNLAYQIPHYSSLTWTMASHVTLTTTGILDVKYCSSSD